MTRRRRRRGLSLGSFAETWVGLRRVKNLVALYDHALATLPIKRHTPPSDILRAAVVLLHAVLEEFVRYVANRTMPTAQAEVLNEIPLVGSVRGMTKFGLGALAAHRGKAVDDLLAASVQQYLDKKSFSSLAEVLRVLGASRVAVSKLRISRASLQRMIERRHQIVHEADRVRDRRPRTDIPRALTRRQVVQWLSAVDAFILGVDKHWQGRGY